MERVGGENAKGPFPSNMLVSTVGTVCTWGLTAADCKSSKSEQRLWLQANSACLLVKKNPCLVKGSRGALRNQRLPLNYLWHRALLLVFRHPDVPPLEHAT